MDWTALGVGVLTAGSALLGGTLASHVQLRGAARSEAAAQRRAEADRRRSVYVNLLVELDAAMAGVRGAIHYRTPRILNTTEATAPLQAARTAAELEASPDAWPAMLPFIEGVTMWTNLVTGQATGVPKDRLDCIREGMSKIGADGEDGLDRLRQQYLVAIREDLKR